jgi:hypothetical protein
VRGVPPPAPIRPAGLLLDQERIGKLRAREVELAALIVCHSFWKGIEGAERTATRDQLKRHRERTKNVVA